MLDQQPHAATLQTVSTVDALAQEVTRQVLGGDPHVMELRESVLSQTYGVARHTVRAALTKLTERGMLTHTANKGWAVPQLSEDDFADVMFLRTALEVQALRAVTLRGEGLGDSAQAALDRLTDTTSSASSSDRLERDMEFHRALVDRAGSKRVSTAYRDIQQVLHLYLIQNRGYLERTPLAEWKSAHTSIATTVLAGDADALEQLVRRTWDYSFDAAGQISWPTIRGRSE